MTAGKFDAQFEAADGRNHLAKLHGAPNARIVSSTLGQPDRVSTSQAVDAAFSAAGWHRVGDANRQFRIFRWAAARQAYAGLGDSARYTPGDQMLTLTGARGWSTEPWLPRPRPSDESATGEALAQDDVKTTYNK